MLRHLRLLRDWLAPRKANLSIRRRLAVELLEDRVTPSAGAREQYMLELVNRMRENPMAELPLLLNSNDADVNSALTYFNVDRNVLQTQWNSLTAAPALAWNDSLASAAYNHDGAMYAAGSQSHQVSGEADLGTRDSAAGYSNWSALGENIFAYAASVFDAHAAFAIDWGNTATGIQNPTGHRDNLMDPGFRDIGIGLLDDPSGANGVGPLLVTQDFGNRSGYGNPFLVGVVYNDANNSGYYDQGEGLNGATISITGASGSFSTASSAYGGYQIQLPAGSYTVTVTGGGLTTPIVKSVTISSTNVHFDLIKGSLPHQDATLPFSDDFNRADNTFIGAYWTPVQGNFSVVNNALSATAPGLSLATVNGLSVADVAVQADVTAGANQGIGLIARYQANGSYYLGMLQTDPTGTSATPYIFKYIAGSGFVQVAGGSNIAFSPATLRFEAAGSSLKLFFGASLVAYGYDGTITAAGTTALRATSGAGIDNFSTTAISISNASLPFTDSFTQADGSQLAHTWTERQGNFAVTGGTLHANDPGPSIAIVNGIAQADIAMQADVTLGANSGLGLVARYQANGSYYLAMLQVDAGGTVFTSYFFEYLAGVGFVQIGAAASIVAGPGTVRFEVVGASLKLFYGPDANHLSVINYAYDRTLTGAGTVGIRSTRGTTLDNVAASAIAMTTPSPPFTDSFTQGDGSQLSRNWTEQQGNFNIVGAALRGNDPAPSIATVNGSSMADAGVQADVTLTANRGVGLVARYQANGSYYVGMVQADAAGAKLTPYVFAYIAGTGFVQVATGPTIAASAGTLRFEVVGASLKLFFGPDANHLALAAYGFDRTLAGAGLGGVRATQGVTLDNVAVAPVSQTALSSLPFTDTFTQSDGAQLSRNWTERQGNFTIAGAAVRGNDPAPSIATLNGISQADSTVQADVTPGANGGAGLIARYQANGSYYLGMILADPTGTRLTPYIFEYVAGVGFMQLAAGPAISASAGTLRIVVVGNSLKLYFGPDSSHLSLVASAIDSTLAAAGLTGMRATRGATLDNFTVS
jgi:uncharacterized protein YkwD